MASAALINKVGRAYDKVRTRFFDSGTEVILLKESNDSERDWDEVTVIDAGWFFEYSNFRQQFLLEAVEAEGSTELTDSVPLATHVQIDTDVYEIAQSDTLPPKGIDVTWKIFCSRTARRGIYRGL